MKRNDLKSARFRGKEHRKSNDSMQIEEEILRLDAN
jgi:hypothetical protein